VRDSEVGGYPREERFPGGITKQRGRSKGAQAAFKFATDPESDYYQTVLNESICGDLFPCLGRP
jgi:hypothetical protein